MDLRNKNSAVDICRPLALEANIKTMKKIANNKCYDTEAATFVAEYFNGYGWNQFKFLRERLYVTKKGNWFLHGEGGPLTEDADSYGNSKSEGERIKEFTPDQALEWLTGYNQTEAIEKYFADRIEEA